MIELNGSGDYLERRIEFELRLTAGGVSSRTFPVVPFAMIPKGR